MKSQATKDGKSFTMLFGSIDANPYTVKVFDGTEVVDEFTESSMRNAFTALKNAGYVARPPRILPIFA